MSWPSSPQMWHHFGEQDRIRSHPDLQHLLAQPLPRRVRGWLDDALGKSATPTSTEPVQPVISETPTCTPISPPELSPPGVPQILNWSDWFSSLKSGNKAAAESFLHEQPDQRALDLSASTIASLSNCLDDFVLNDTLRNRERVLIVQGVGDLLEAYVREAGFPQTALAGFYLSMARLWCALHAGNSAGQPPGRRSFQPGRVGLDELAEMHDADSGPGL